VATSLRGVWRRWHISLSGILRDYVYIPLGGNRRHVTLNLVVTFALCGIWHFLIPQVVIWGVIMGLMLAVNQRWVQWMERLDAAPTGTLQAIRRKIEHFHAMNIFNDADTAAQLSELKSQLFGLTGETLKEQPDLAEKLSQACAVLKQELLDPSRLSALTGRLKRRVVLD